MIAAVVLAADGAWNDFNGSSSCHASTGATFSSVQDSATTTGHASWTSGSGCSTGIRPDLPDAPPPRDAIQTPRHGRGAGSARLASDTITSEQRG